MAMFSSASIYYTICFEILETTTLNTLEGNCKFTTAMINSIISPSLTTRPLWNKQPILFSFFSYFVECCRLSNIIHTLLCSISITLKAKRLKKWCCFSFYGPQNTRWCRHDAANLRSLVAFLAYAADFSMKSRWKERKKETCFKRTLHAVVHLSCVLSLPTEMCQWKYAQIFFISFSYVIFFIRSYSPISANKYTIKWIESNFIRANAQKSLAFNLCKSKKENNRLINRN